MKIRILDRYLFWETTQVWLAVTAVLLTILLSNRFTKVLAQAATGEIPREFLMKVAGFNGLRFLVLLVPVSLMLAIMLALGRLYKDQEIAAMAGCGAGMRHFYRPFAWLAASLALFTALLSFEWGPWAARRMDALLTDASVSVQYSPFEAGHFKAVAGGRAMFYSDAVDERGVASGVFAEIPEDKGTSLITAQRGEHTIDPATGERILQLRDGVRYAGTPGRADYDVLSFDTFSLRIRPPQIIESVNKRDRALTGDLWISDDPQDRAELHWRLAAPLSVLLLAFLAVPLAQLGPRDGRYSKLVWGIVAYLIYSNLLGIGQTLLKQGVVSETLGLWWVHGIAAFAVLLLIQIRRGGFTRKSLFAREA